MVANFVRQNSPLSTPATSSPYEIIADQLYSQGYAICDNFLSPEQVDDLVEDMLQLWDEGEFRFAQIGVGDDKQLCPQVRSDRIHWLDPMALSSAQQTYISSLESLRLAINRATMMGLFEWEGHLAIYPPQTFYRRHLDVFRNARARKVSTILYLNKDWSPVDGGELRLYVQHNDDIEQHVDIAPQAGRLVIFLSEIFYHEVLLSHAHRKSITGWFRVRE